MSYAEQLPIRIYTTADGLPRDAVTHIEQDSRGFIWLIAGDGLSRFDGYRFVNYTTDDGLPDRRVNDLLEARNGIYWIATDAGLCRFNPTGNRLRNADLGFRIEQNESSAFSIRNPQSEIRNSEAPMFIVYNPQNGQKATAFNILIEDESGVIWCGTSDGLYRLDVSPDGDAQLRSIDLGMARESGTGRNVLSLVKDRKDFLWAGTENGVLYRLSPDGRVERYADQQGLPQSSPITSLLEDRDGIIWAGTHSGLFNLVAEPSPARAVVSHTYLKKDGLASPWIMSLYQTRDGKLWVATSAGLSVYDHSSEGARAQQSFHLYNVQNGMCDYEIWDMTEDHEGNLWLASRCGVIKIMRNGSTGYGLADGLGVLAVNSIFEDREGAVVVINSAEANRPAAYTGRIINRFDGARFTSVAPNLPSKISYHGWGWGQTILQDHLGQWWIPTGFGLYRFPKVDRLEQLARVQPEQIHAPAGGLDKVEIFRLYEDSRGDMWVVTTGQRDELWRWERATNSLHDLTEETGVPPYTDFTFFAEDRAGNLWIGTSESLLRYFDGKFERFTVADGVPPGWVIWLYLDHAGRLWIGSQLGGLNRIDDPTASALHLQRYTTADGLSSNNIRSITEDEWGRIYVGTGHGVDRLDPETGAVKHFTVADGLPKGTIEQAYRDHQGALWFGSYFGVSRLVPERQESRTPPSVYITGLRIEGVARRISELGETALPQTELTSDQKQVSIEFVGLGASLGEELRYQYRLEGAGNDWSAPTSERTINYANLAPGRYRFMVRAVNAEGQQSPTPATFTFRIAAPIWQRWWFWAAVALFVSLTAFMLYRSRVARLLEVANMRTRIATDLHDDIGSGLSRVAILSEVVKRQTGASAPQAEPILTEIADSARMLVDSMRDIVWAIDPGNDDLASLIYRVRQFASDVIEPRKIEFDFPSPPELARIKLDPEQRRHLYLIFKEAINNIARHADCSCVTLGIRIVNNFLTAEIIDDGRGFIVQPKTETNGRGGHGLENMRRRVSQLGGRLGIESNPGRGTRLHLSVPLNQ